MHEGTGVVSCNRGVTHEADFTARGEESKFNVVVRSVGGEYESDLFVDLAGDAPHFLLGELLGIEHDSGRVPAKTLAGKRVDEKQWATALGH